jgi:hypothetical protein
LRFLIAVGIGIAATLGWQSYGDAAREIIASSYPQLGWLAPQAAAAPAAPATIAAATASLDQQELRTVSLGLAAVRQRVDQLILDKISQAAPPPAAAPARKPVPPPAQPAPLR